MHPGVASPTPAICHPTPTPGTQTGRSDLRASGAVPGAGPPWPWAVPGLPAVPASSPSLTQGLPPGIPRPHRVRFPPRAPESPNPLRPPGEACRTQWGIKKKRPKSQGVSPGRGVRCARRFHTRVLRGPHHVPRRRAVRLT